QASNVCLKCLWRCRVGPAGCPVLLGPANGACRITKSEEMRAREAQGGLADACGRDCAQKVVRRFTGKDVAGKITTRAQHSQRCTHAAAQSIADQLGALCRTGDADPERCFDPAFAQTAGEANERLGIEQKLADKERLKAGSLGGSQFVDQRLLQRVFRYSRMIFGVAGEVNALDAVLLKKTGLDDLKRGREGACRIFAVAAQHKGLGDACSCLETGKEVL